MTPTPEPRRQVTREMIEAHYKSVMNAARRLLSQGETIHAQDLLSEACSRPYPIPAPASMPEATGRENVVSWSTSEQTDLASFARAYLAMRAAQKSYFNTRSREDLIFSKQLEKALDKAAALIVAKATATAREGTQ